MEEIPTTCQGIPTQCWVPIRQIPKTNILPPQATPQLTNHVAYRPHHTEQTPPTHKESCYTNMSSLRRCPRNRDTLPNQVSSLRSQMTHAKNGTRMWCKLNHIPTHPRQSNIATHLLCEQNPKTNNHIQWRPTPKSAAVKIMIHTQLSYLCSQDLTTHHSSKHHHTPIYPHLWSWRGRRWMGTSQNVEEYMIIDTLNLNHTISSTWYITPNHQLPVKVNTDTALWPPTPQHHMICYSSLPICTTHALRPEYLFTTVM